MVAEASCVDEFSGEGKMVDTLSAAMRSEVMSRVRAKDTRPEMVVRRLIYHAGYRYRLHAAHLPGSPDLVFNGRRKVIFVHGCFWHSHNNCRNARIPKSRVEFWITKLESNRVRDERNLRELAEAGWQALVIWECELRNPDLVAKLTSFLK